MIESHVRCFDPRAREGRDPREQPNLRRMAVSIRAPVKGATGDRLATDEPDDVSIRAPVKGATRRRATESA